MLEFQEGFLQQEIREGFYLDATMKTVWAAELELLQKVAEVCDKYGLKWYAAYGTLLGAIRHEGFVPWDDDMDIWMLRKDYNKLMQVLPKELPEGYHVRSALTEDGYDQFHSCIISGEGISIAQDWLEQFHGCPFTVGLDVFPLDYLPRDENERELQKGLITLAGRIAQSAKNVENGDFDEQENRDELIEELKEEVLEGIAYLKENCNLPINEKLIEEERWFEAASEMWKWANHLAMIYEEEESDYLVEYLDYIRWDFKVYPKEWFDSGYSAKFENFMIPIPAGYQEVLNTIYDDYMYCIPKTGSHEYPYYARQLRQLREYVNKIEKQAVEYGMARPEDIELTEDTSIPEKWLPIVTKADGTRKRIVLFAGNVEEFAQDAEKNLQFLEETLSSFEKEKDGIALWWRPSPAMKQVLDSVDPAYGQRYQAILETYEKAGWGILDDTVHMEVAAANSDIYYGQMNAVIQEVQNNNVPVIVIAGTKEQRQWNNQTTKFRSRAYVAYTDSVSKDGKRYFSNNNYNALIIQNEDTGEWEQMLPFTGVELVEKNLHLKCMEWGDKLFFAPFVNGPLHVYDCQSRELLKFDLVQEEEKPNIQNTWEWFTYQEELYMLPAYSAYDMWKWNGEKNEPEKVDWWQSAEGEWMLEHGTMSEDKFYTLAVVSNQLLITDMARKQVQSFILPDEHISHIRWDGERFWYTLCYDSRIVCWEPQEGVVCRIEFPYEETYYVPRGYSFYRGFYYAEHYLFLLCQDTDKIYVYDIKRGKFSCIHNMSWDSLGYHGMERHSYFQKQGRDILCHFRNMCEKVIIHLDTLECDDVVENFEENPLAECYDKKILLKRHSLLLEEKGKYDLETVKSYCRGEE